jgi:hypothetical protein
VRYILYTLGVLLAFAALLGLGLGTSWFGLVTHRPMAKYAEETRREVYDTSRAYTQGTVGDLRRYCAQWRHAEGGSRDGAAELIRATYATYTGPELPADVRACIGEVQ